MGRSSEILRGDLRAIHSALGEVLSCTQPEVPSWHFPGKLSTSVTLDDQLARCEPNDREDLSEGACLLEGIIDRLLLLLQSSLKLWNEADGRPSHPLPLSLSSVVKKYCKQLVQKVKHVQSLQQQLTGKDEAISSLTSSVSEAQEQCQLLQDALNSATSDSRPSSVLPRAVPYEARNSLKINRLQSSQTERQSLYDNIPEKTQPLPASKSSPLIATRNPASSSVPSCTSVCTQTTETAFALCVRCSSSLTTLTSAAGSMQRVCSSLHVPSLSAETDWKREAELGVLELGKWIEALDTDLKRIESHSLEQEKELVCLSEHLTHKQSREELLQSNLSRLSLECDQLEGVVSASKRAHAQELARCQEAAKVQLSEMERAHKSVQGQRDRLGEKLSQVQKEKDELTISSADIERQQYRLQAELLEVRDREKALHGSQAALQNQLKWLQTELSECRNELEAERLQLSKTTALNNTLQRKHKTRLSRQHEVLQRIEEMDREAEDMRRELNGSVSARNQLTSRVEQLQTECSCLHGQVADYESKLAVSAEQQQKLHEDLTSLELQLASISSELEAEKEKCRLLVTCPDQSFTTTTRPSNGPESRKYISANTIRILLLEEQNSELRESMLQHVRQKSGRRKAELVHPIPLWEHGVVSEVQSALLGREKVVPEHPSTHQQQLPLPPLGTSHKKVPGPL